MDQKRQWLILVVPLLFLPFLIFAVKKVQELRRRATVTEGPFSIRIAVYNGCSLEALSPGDECPISALVYDAEGNPWFHDFNYFWSISSSGSVATLTQTEGPVTTIKALDYGKADVTVVAQLSNTDLQVEKGIRVEVGDFWGFCGDTCSDDSHCQEGLTCWREEETVSNENINISCQADSDCRFCGTECVARSGNDDLICAQVFPPEDWQCLCLEGQCTTVKPGICRNPQCPEKKDCSCPLETPKDNAVDWETETVHLRANNFYLIIGGKVYTARTSDSILIRSDPGDANYTTLELTWHENGREMRLFLYFEADEGGWRIFEVRTYNGLEPGDWIDYRLPEDPLGADIGQPFFKSQLDLKGKTGEIEGIIHFDDIQISTSLGGAGEITPSVPPPEGTPVLNFKITFAGVADSSKVKEVPKVSVKIKKGFDLVAEFADVALQPAEGAAFRGRLVLTGVDPGDNLTIYIKGPKHLARKFCQNNQTERCTGMGKISLKPGENNFDFTRLSLEPGDLPDPTKNMAQDGVVNSDDLSRLKLRLGKTDSSDLAIADLDFNGVVNTRDVVLFLQTLSTKYEEEE